MSESKAKANQQVQLLTERVQQLSTQLTAQRVAVQQSGDHTMRVVAERDAAREYAGTLEDKTARLSISLRHQQDISAELRIELGEVQHERTVLVDEKSFFYRVTLALAAPAAYGVISCGENLIRAVL